MDWAFYGDSRVGRQISTFQVAQAGLHNNSIPFRSAKRGDIVADQPAALGLKPAAEAKQPLKLKILSIRF